MTRYKTLLSSGLLLALAAMLWPPFRTSAADAATVKLFEAKCASCHGADGVGNTPVAKLMPIQSWRNPEVQKLTDEQLTTIVTKGKDKMPAYEKTLKPDEIKALVAYVRELGQRK